MKGFSRLVKSNVKVCFELPSISNSYGKMFLVVKRAKNKNSILFERFPIFLSLERFKNSLRFFNLLELSVSPNSFAFAERH